MKRMDSMKIKTWKTLLTELVTSCYLFMGLLKRTLEQRGNNPMLLASYWALGELLWILFLPLLLLLFLTKSWMPSKYLLFIDKAFLPFIICLLFCSLSFYGFPIFSHFCFHGPQTKHLTPPWAELPVQVFQWSRPSLVRWKKAYPRAETGAMEGKGGAVSLAGGGAGEEGAGPETGGR